MNFITEVICKLIFTDVHMRNKYRPNRDKDVNKLVKYFYIQLIALNTNLNYNTKVSLKIQHYYFLKCIFCNKHNFSFYLYANMYGFF